jgi:hypothetical protein
MKIESFSSTQPLDKNILADISHGISSAPDLLLVYSTVGMPMDAVLQGLSQKYPKAKIAGSTSCNAVMTNTGYHSVNGQGLGGLAFTSDTLDYGIGYSAVQAGAVDVKQACESSLGSAKKFGILPTLIWMMCSPGMEESCIQGITDYFGTFVPVFGGTAADNDLTGKWRLFFDQQSFESGLIVVTFFDIPTPSFSFHCGYQQTEFKGCVTKSLGRKLIEIDHRPAAQVYDEWTGGLISRSLTDKKEKFPKNILNISSLFPLARRRGDIASNPLFLLSHPETVTAKKEITLFTDIQIGDEVFLMEGSVESLQRRASEVIKSVLMRERITEDDMAGVLIVYCAGCMLTVSSVASMQPVFEGIKSALGQKTPFLGILSYGEQGCFIDEDNFHGNLMISVTIFLKNHRL